MDKKLHILFLSSWYPSRVDLTNGYFVQKHAEAIATKHKVTVVFSIGDKNIKSKYEIVDLCMNNVNTKIIYFKKTKNVFINTFRKLKALNIGLSKTLPFDIIHGNIIYPIGVFIWVISKLKKKPYILTEHWTGYLPDDSNSLSQIKKEIVRKIVKDAEFIIPVSFQLQEAMKQLNINGNYKVIGNVIDTSFFYPLHAISDKFTIVHISTLNDSQKNISGILNVIQKLTKLKIDFVIKIIGSDNLLETQKKIYDLQIPSEKIILENVKSSKEIAKILQKANLYISFSNYETFGIVMVEALACGVPVISTNTGILTELKFSNHITIIKKNDEDALYLAILKHLNSNSKLDNYKIHNFINQLFGIDNIANEYCRVYQNALTSYYKLN